MGHFIDLDSLHPLQSLWMVPREFMKFDQRDPPWPNHLWPFAAVIDTTHEDFSANSLILMRRWCTRDAVGDMVVMFASRHSSQDTVVACFDRAEDCHSFCQQWQWCLLDQSQHSG
jgi:hypothetical protein